MDYCIILGFILISTLLLYTYAKKRNKVILIFLIGLIIIVCAIRQVIPGVINSDAYVYKTFYEKAFGNTFSNYLLYLESNEVGFYGFFWLCAKLRFSYDTVRVIYYMVMLIFALKIVNENEIENNSYFDVLFIMTNFILSNCLMRNCMAYIIGWYAISLIHNKKNVKAVILCAVAVAVHTSAIIVLLYVIFRICISIIKNIRWMILFVIAMYLSVVFVLPSFMNYIGSLNDKMAYYLETTTGSFAITTNIIGIIILILLLFLYHSKNRYFCDEKYQNAILLCFFSIVIIFMQLVSGISYRFLAYFDILYIVDFGYIRTADKNRCITCGGYDVISHMLSIINIVVLILFMFNSLTGYGLIPIKW